MYDEILVVLKKVDENGNLIKIKNDYKKLQELVAGYFEVIFFTEDIAIIVNEDGHYLKLKENIELYANNGYKLPLLGDIIIAGYKEDEFIDLKEEQMEFLKNIGILLENQ